MNWDEYFMRHVYLAASKSKDPRTKIGAVLVKENQIVSTGYNGFPREVKDIENRYNTRTLKYKFIVHAEANAVLQCAFKGSSAKDTIMYTQGVPCNECTKSIIQAGVSKIIVHKQWPNLNHSDIWKESFAYSNIMLGEAGIEVHMFDGVLGMVGRLDGKDIEV